MTPIQTLKQMHSIDIYTNVPKPFVNKWYGRFRNAWTVGSPHGRPLFKDKKQPLAIKNVIESNPWKTVCKAAVSVGCIKSTAQRV